MKLYILILFVLIGFSSCDNSCDSTKYTEEVNAQAVILTAAFDAYSADPTNIDICMEYEAELQNHIAVYEKYQTCSDLNVGNSIDNSITIFQDRLDALDCN